MWGGVSHTSFSEKEKCGRNQEFRSDWWIVISTIINMDHVNFNSRPIRDRSFPFHCTFLIEEYCSKTRPETWCVETSFENESVRMIVTMMSCPRVQSLVSLGSLLSKWQDSEQILTFCHSFVYRCNNALLLILLHGLVDYALHDLWPKLQHPAASTARVRPFLTDEAPKACVDQFSLDCHHPVAVPVQYIWILVFQISLSRYAFTGNVHSLGWGTAVLRAYRRCCPRVGVDSVTM